MVVGDRSAAIIGRLFAAPVLRRRVIVMLTLVGVSRILHRVVETVW